LELEQETQANPIMNIGKNAGIGERESRFGRPPACLEGRVKMGVKLIVMNGKKMGMEGYNYFVLSTLFSLSREFRTARVRSSATRLGKY